MRIRFLFLTFLLLLLSACSLSRSQGTPAAKQTVIAVATQYLGHIVMNDRHKIDGMVLWLDFLDNSSGTVTKEICFAQMQAAANRFDQSNHPLVHLTIHEVQVRGDNAAIILQKHGDPKAKKIEITLRWIGNGWLIVGDNIFGTEGVLARALRQHT